MKESAHTAAARRVGSAAPAAERDNGAPHAGDAAPPNTMDMPPPLSVADAEQLLREMAQALSLGPLLPQQGVAFAGLEDTASGAVPAAIGIIAVDERGAIHAFNDAAERIFGYQAATVVGHPVEVIFAAPLEPGTRGGQRPADDRSGESATRGELYGRRADGSTFPIAVTRSAVEMGRTRLLVLAVRDVGADLLAEEQRRRAEARYRSLVEQIPAVTFTAALNESVTEFYVSPQIEALLGFSQTEWLSNPFLWYRQLHPDDRERCHLEFARGCLTGGPFRAEFRALTRNDDIVWVRGEARVVRDAQGNPLFIQGVAYDITESKRAEDAIHASAKQIQASLREKEVLLEEIHHRVKNNLQVISSLLKLQSAHVRDRTALEMFAESRNRIQSMALVHEKLCQANDLSQLDFAEYIQNLAELLFRSYRGATSAIHLHTQVGEVRLGIDVAVPLGLIINELVSNCLKYAFPAGRRGTVHLELQPADDTYVLRVADDGIGLRSEIDVVNATSLGLQLVSALSRQIGGVLAVDRNGGTQFEIRFPRERG